MKLNRQVCLSIGLAAPALAYPRLAINERQSVPSGTSRVSAIKEAFRTSWEGYYQHAFPHDTLHPISNTAEDDRNAWGVTAIDSLSTAIILGEDKIVNQILDFVPKIDFSTTKKSQEAVSVFESTIRYLGGLVSSYDLLKGPMSNLTTNSSNVDSLLKQATSLADSLSVAFDTKSGTPAGSVVLNPEAKTSGGDTNSPAGIGTLVLEWTRLSDLTGDDKYAKLSQKGEDFLLHPTGTPLGFPGLIGSTVDTETGEFTDNSGGWVGGIDSYYEYLIKMYLYDPSAFGEYKDRWVVAADSTMKHLASHPTTRQELTFLSQHQGNTTSASSGHLTSFAGGSFILGGILLNEQKYVDFGVDLARSYYATYRGAPSGLGPEGFSWVDSAQKSGSPPSDQADLYEDAGFWATSAAYILRPETMESLYYAYRVTDDSQFQDLAWEAFQHMWARCRAGSGFSGISDVTDLLGGSKDDFQQSFWTAETLKYLYLIFAPDSAVQVQVDKPNEFVYNTEAHPVKVRR